MISVIVLAEEHDFVGIGFISEAESSCKLLSYFRTLCLQMDLIAKLRHRYIVEYKDDLVEKSLPCVPNFPSQESPRSLESLCLGKYVDVTTPVSTMRKAWMQSMSISIITFSITVSWTLASVSSSFGLEFLTVEIVIPELHEMRIAHIVSIGSESLCTLNLECGGGKGEILVYDTRTDLAFFHSFIAADYVAAQRLRRRLMYFHMEIFEKGAIIVTPTTRNIPITISYTSFFINMTPPRIPPSAIKVGEIDLQVSSFFLSHLLPDIINYGVS
ncbi:hypothetical protein KY284_012718 [Solanum tuberosum]|nr:hypothetical protein KY284_012718 [Solanum tuberosum]